MKKIILSAILLLAGFALAQAQEDSTAVKHSFFIGGGAGIAVNPMQGVLGPAAELYVGKWFDESIGLRAGVHAMSYWGDLTYFSGYASLDFLWSFLSKVEWRGVWTPVISPFMGWRLSGLDRESGICMGVNLLNNFSLSEHLELGANAAMMCGFDPRNGGTIPFFTAPTTFLSVGLNYRF